MTTPTKFTTEEFGALPRDENYRIGCLDAVYARMTGFQIMQLQIDDFARVETLKSPLGVYDQ